MLMLTGKISNSMQENFNRGGRPLLPDKCSHCIKVRFNDAETDALTRMMEKADEKTKATFIKQLIFGKPFRVLVTDKTLAAYLAKLSEFFAQYRSLGVNYNTVVNELRQGFSEKKAMQLLYKLEKATIEMAGIMAEVRDLSIKFDERWLQKSQ